jgi:hypothetical protein
MSLDEHPASVVFVAMPIWMTEHFVADGAVTFLALPAALAWLPGSSRSDAQRRERAGAYPTNSI